MTAPHDLDIVALARECEVLARAEAATELLAKGMASQIDEAELRRSLQRANEAYRRLQSFAGENGGRVSAEVQQAMGSLVRLTLRTIPVLLHAGAKNRARSLH